MKADRGAGRIEAAYPVEGLGLPDYLTITRDVVGSVVSDAPRTWL
jgi:hypothetical protein